MTIETLAQQVLAFERAFLGAPTAVRDVQLAKLMCLAAGLLIAKAFPDVLSIDVGWYLALVVLLALAPISTALHLFTHMDEGEFSPGPTRSLE